MNDDEDHFIRCPGCMTLKSRPCECDKPAKTMADGSEVTPDHRELKDNGQQKGYVVLSEAERAKGFVRPLRRAYVHVGIDPVMDGSVLIKPGANGCGTNTKMGMVIAETYARDPKFYSATFCCGCREHRTLSEFVWEGTEEIVGS